MPLAVVAPTIDESLREGESPAAYLERVSAEKLVAARAAAAVAGVTAFGAVLVADTTVTLDDAILDKPTTVDEAKDALVRLSHRTHRVATRFLLGAADGDASVLHAETVVTEVTFRALDPDEIAAYAASREGFDKAGGYGIQGGAAGFVRRIDGSYTSVVGLPLAEVVAALRACGLLPASP